MAKGKFAEWLEPDGLLRIEGWARDGLTDKQIAHNIGITEQTLNVWKKQFPSILESLKKSKEVVDREVENALHKRAIGFKIQVNKPLKVKREYFDEYGRKCSVEEVVQAEETMYIPPDTTAQIFWLKNRKRDVWGDKAQQVDEAKQDDGFIDALNGTAEQDWADEAGKESDIQV